ncbi:MAG: putative lipid II flippase FtsW [Patescibacteria group bacterium]|nr:putative lipid II flippase FtsW [Patescibacteria group bacterium]
MSLVLFLVVLGLIAIWDASAPLGAKEFGDKFYYVKQQFLWAILGFLGMWFFYKFNLHYLKVFSNHIFYFASFLLVIVLIPSIGISLLGARRWIDVGFVSFQPSEFMKLALTIQVASLISSRADFKKVIVVFLIAVGLIMLQPDLGTALVIAAIFFSQLFVSGFPLVNFVFLAAGGLLASIILIMTSDYRRQRFMTFLSETTDPLGHGYHIRQVLLALGSGGLLGVGFGHSRQKHLFLPETANDSIFAIIAEELGFVGSLFLIFLLVYFIYRCLLIAKEANDYFKKILAIGITGWFGGQILLNIGSMVALFPITGIPLPFFSYGGTSLVVIMCACGIMLNISKNS